jgi:hypothetical protein
MPLLPHHYFASQSSVPHDLSAQNMFIITFTDGSVGVYNIASLSWIYFRHGGHTEVLILGHTTI